jgi:uncharacterized protein YciI
MASYYAVFGTDKPDMREVRERVRSGHRTYLRSAAQHGVFVRLGGPTLAPLCKVDDIAAVMQFAGNGPYMKEGFVARMEAGPWDWSLCNSERRVWVMNASQLCQVAEVPDGGARVIDEERAGRPAVGGRWPESVGVFNSLPAFFATA